MIQGHGNAPMSIRDMSEEQFTAKYGADRFTCNVLSNRYKYVAEHMGTNLVARAFSQIISFSYDFVGAVMGPIEYDFPLVGMNKGNFNFLGSLTTGVRAAVTEFGAERLRPGDLLVVNDPFRVGNHVNDLCFIRPVFHDGAIISFVVIRAHQLDMGGTVPGGFGLMKMNVFENGLVVGPMLLFHEDEPVKETIRLLLDNSRFGETILPDLYTVWSSLRLGERLLHETMDRYGKDAYLGAIRHSIDASAESMQRAIAELPDGDYVGEDILDSDGVDERPYRVRVTIRKRGDRIEVDLTGTSKQARTALNATALEAQNGASLALKVLLDPHSDFTSGVYRHVDVAVPPATILSAIPDASTMFYWEVMSSMMTAVFRALSEPLGSRAIGGSYGSTNGHTGTGVNPDGTPWFTASELEAQFGGWGATDAGDADGHSGLFSLNQRVTPTEEIEQHAPVVVMRREYLPDTGGPGQHRGGSGLAKDSLFLRDGDHILVPLHFREPSGFGVHGGEDGRQGGGWLYPGRGRVMDEGAYSPIPVDEFEGAAVVSGWVDDNGRLDPEGSFAFFGRHRVWPESRGAMLRWITNGGGGWGDAFERDVDAVLRDVRNGYVSVEGALRDYGVVVVGDVHNDPEGLAADVAATEAARVGPRSRPEAPARHDEGELAVQDGPVLVRRRVEGACPACGEQQLSAYPVLSEGGWHDVVKCQACLTSVSRERDVAGPIRVFSATI